MAMPLARPAQVKSARRAGIYEEANEEGAAA